MNDMTQPLAGRLGDPDRLARYDACKPSPVIMANARKKSVLELCGATETISCD